MPHPTVPEPFSHIAVRMSEKPNHIYITIDASCREEICATWGRGTSCPPFLRYISGPHFVILSDHKPLQHILERLLSCLQWPWLRYNTGHWFWKDGKQQANADLFRRLLPVLPETILFVETLDSSPSLLPRSHWGPRRTLSYPRWRTLYSVDGSIQVREHSPPAGRQQVISYTTDTMESQGWSPSLVHLSGGRVLTMTRREEGNDMTRNPGPTPLYILAMGISKNVLAAATHRFCRPSSGNDVFHPNRCLLQVARSETTHTVAAASSIFAQYLPHMDCQRGWSQIMAPSLLVQQHLQHSWGTIEYTTSSHRHTIQPAMGQWREQFNVVQWKLGLQGFCCGITSPPTQQQESH